jgi:hypothetical protein
VAHVGCVTVPAVGAAGVAGCALTTIFDDMAKSSAFVCVSIDPALAVTNPVPDILTTGEKVYVLVIYRSLF